MLFDRVCVCVCVVLSYFTSANCNYQRWPGYYHLTVYRSFFIAELKASKWVRCLELLRWCS